MGLPLQAPSLRATDGLPVHHRQLLLSLNTSQADSESATFKGATPRNFSLDWRPMSREEREPDLATRSSPRPPDTERGHPPTPATESYPKAGVAAPVVVPEAPKTLGAPGEGASDPGAPDGNLFRDTLKDEKPPHETDGPGVAGP